jgi:hypothetical protein
MNIVDLPVSDSRDAHTAMPTTSADLDDLGTCFTEFVRRVNGDTSCGTNDDDSVVGTQGAMHVSSVGKSGCWTPLHMGVGQTNRTILMGEKPKARATTTVNVTCDSALLHDLLCHATHICEARLFLPERLTGSAVLEWTRMTLSLLSHVRDIADLLWSTSRLLHRTPALQHTESFATNSARVVQDSLKGSVILLRARDDGIPNAAACGLLVGHAVLTLVATRPDLLASCGIQNTSRGQTSGSAQDLMDEIQECFEEQLSDVTGLASLSAEASGTGSQASRGSSDLDDDDQDAEEPIEDFDNDKNK